jgi:homospermidine synthase
MRPGASTRVRTWTPLEGPFHGFLITHNESISLADYYTARNADGSVRYRPTSHYAYHPCDDAVLSVHELAGKNWEMQPEKRLMTDEIVRGMDELGVLLMGHAKGAYWYGSRLTIEEARRVAPHNNATSVIWAIENPRRGVVESDEMDHARILEICAPYLGEVVGVYSDWTPLQGRGVLFPEDVDQDDPWQFRNIRVT